MASESGSSAVLDLNDADAEDTEAPSVTDDAQEGAPLIMEHGYDIAVKVDAPLKQLSTLETFVTYRVRCVCARWPSPPAVRRRYNHFKALHTRLTARYPLLAIPPLPPLHSARQQLDRYSPGFVRVRCAALHCFLDRVAKHPILTYSEDFRLFLTTPDEELDKLFKSENNALNLWGLSSAIYGNSSDTKQTTNGARVKDPEFSAASDYLQSLQHKLTTLCSLTTKLYKGTAQLSTQLMTMKRACDLWSCSTSGQLARAVSGCGGGAAAAAAAAARLPAPVRARAVLPSLAAYAQAQQAKIRQRDAMHAAHVSGSAPGEVHNRLEQASEALRCDLADWGGKTRADIQAILRDMAAAHVQHHAQVLMGWEHALKLSTEANVDDLFKTVSKTAVQNLSPSKCRADITPTETDKDFDELDNYSDSDIQELRLEESELKRTDQQILDQNSITKNEKMIDEHEILDKTASGSEEKGIKEILEQNEQDIFGRTESKENFERKESKENGFSSKESKIGSKVETLSDPLQDFSEVDLSS